jgi:hypothetical protein
MRTAIQELMHILDVNEKNFISIIDDKITIAYHNVIKKQVEHLLEKEKEQIIDAYENGVGHENERNLSGQFTCAIKYYNQIYNQNES